MEHNGHIDRFSVVLGHDFTYFWGLGRVLGFRV